MRTSLDWKGRWRPALFGASAGLLAATLFINLRLPGFREGWVGPFCVLSLVLGALVGIRAWWSFVGWLIVALTALLALLIFTPVMTRAISAWPRTDPTPGRPLDGIVVLSAGMTSEGRLGLGGVERLLSGLELQRATHAPLLVTTRLAFVVAGGSVTSDADQRSLVAASGDTARWRIVGPAKNTHDEAVRTAELFSPASGRTIAVVTSPPHSRRACATFEAVGFRVVCAPSVSRSYSVRRPSSMTDRFRALADYVYERLGMIEYRARGWVRS